MTRRVWNYRCDLCFNEAVVFTDNNRCYYCDPASKDEYERREAELTKPQKGGGPA